MEQINIIEQIHQEDEIQVEEFREVRSPILEFNDDGGDNIESEGDIRLQNNDGDVGDKSNGDQKDDENEADNSHFQRKKRKKVSKVHNDFSELTLNDGSIKLQCVHCKILLSKPTTATTTHLWNHMKSIKDWGIEQKVFTISVDNASNNDVAIRIAKETFSKSHKLPLDGKLFHVRCAAHILNLVVQDGLSEIKCIIEDVKDSVRFINQSESRLRKFSDIVHHLGISVKKLIIDCPTRWNSTYEMLVEAFKVRDAFPIFAQRELSYTSCPSTEDWDKVKDVIEILEVFYEATHVISGTNYPTSNVFLAVIWRVKHVLNEKEKHLDEFVRVMVKMMKQKFDKYWGECNLLMAIGAILDPRFKMRLVEFAFNRIYNEFDAHTNLQKVRDALYALFYEYMTLHQMRARKGSSSILDGYSTSTSSTSKGRVVPSGLSMFDDYLNTVEEHAPVKSELDIYLEEGVFRCQDGESGVASEFDALAWWKFQELKFNVLSKLACDVLAIPISTVASEATFSAGTRVLDPYRARLSSDMVQVLICGADWVHQLHGINKPIMTHEDEESVHVVLQE